MEVSVISADKNELHYYTKLWVEEQKLFHCACPISVQLVKLMLSILWTIICWGTGSADNINSSRKKYTGKLCSSMNGKLCSSMKLPKSADSHHEVHFPYVSTIFVRVETAATATKSTSNISHRKIMMQLGQHQVCQLLCPVSFLTSSFGMLPLLGSSLLVWTVEKERIIIEESEYIWTKGYWWVRTDDISAK